MTDKPDWHEKVFDDTIVAKWRKEAMEQPEDELYARILNRPRHGLSENELPKPRARILSDKAFDYCIAELRSKAALCKETGLSYALDADGNAVLKSDHTLVPKQLHERLVAAFAELRAAQAANVDWHPRTDDKVQDLVHPSMYPFVYGQESLLSMHLPPPALMAYPRSLRIPPVRGSRCTERFGLHDERDSCAAD